MILSIYQSAPDFATIHSIYVFEDDCVVVFYLFMHLICLRMFMKETSL